MQTILIVPIPAGLLTAYLVATGLTTVRPVAAGARWPDIGAMLFGWSIGLTALI